MTSHRSQTDTNSISQRDLRRAVKAAVDRIAPAGIDPLLTPAEFSGALGVGKTKFWEMSKAPGFPPAVVLSARCVRYKASEVRAFIEALSHTAA